MAKPIAIFVSSYSVEVFQKGSTNPLPLKFDGGKTLYLALSKYLGDLNKTPSDDNYSTILQVKKLTGDGANLSGLIERGEYGYPAAFIKSQTFVPSINRAVDDAEMRSFYFRFHLPDEQSNGIVVLQRRGATGTLSELEKHLAGRFRDDHPDHRIEFKRLVPNEVIDALLKGRVTQLKVETHRHTKDIADSVGVTSAEMDVGTIIVSFKAKRGKSLWEKTPAWVKNLQDSKLKVSKVKEDSGGDKRTVFVDYQGRPRQYVVDARNQIAPYLDITPHVKSAYGTPEFDSIDEYSVGLVDTLRKELGWEDK